MKYWNLEKCYILKNYKYMKMNIDFYLYIIQFVTYLDFFYFIPGLNLN